VAATAAKFRFSRGGADAVGLLLPVGRATQTLDASLRTIAMSQIRTSIVREGSSAVLPTGFPESELERLAGCVDRLLSHVRQADIAVTGGVAIELGLAEIGHTGCRTRIADLDCVAGSLDAVAPSVCDAFLVSLPRCGARCAQVHAADRRPHIGYLRRRVS